MLALHARDALIILSKKNKINKLTALIISSVSAVVGERPHSENFPLWNRVRVTWSCKLIHAITKWTKLHTCLQSKHNNLCWNHQTVTRQLPFNQFNFNITTVTLVHLCKPLFIRKNSFFWKKGISLIMRIYHFNRFSISQRPPKEFSQQTLQIQFLFLWNASAQQFWKNQLTAYLIWPCFIPPLFVLPHT